MAKEITREEKKSMNWKKIFANRTQVIRNQYPRYTRNSNNSATTTTKIDLKMAKGSVQAIPERREMNGQQVHEEVFNIFNHEGNANSNHNIISPSAH